MTRAEHLAWCKERALDELERGDLAGAVASMASDLGKHDETRDSVIGPLVMLGMEAVSRRDAQAVRDWITGFN